MAQNHYETIMQSIIALGLAARIISKASPKQFKHCIDAAVRADKVIKQFEEMPTGKKILFNKLFDLDKEDYEFVCGKCYDKYDIRACPLCNHINED